MIAVKLSSLLCFSNCIISPSCLLKMSILAMNCHIYEYYIHILFLLINDEKICKVKVRKILAFGKNYSCKSPENI